MVAGKMAWTEKMEVVEMTPFQNALMKQGLPLVHDDGMPNDVQFCVGYTAIVGMETLNEIAMLTERVEDESAVVRPPLPML